MNSIRDILTQCLSIDPTSDLEGQLAQFPGRWAVYLMCDHDDKPIQLLSVRNLRASLKRRLGGDEVIGTTKKVNYREIVRKIYYARVDSAFESDWVYFQSAAVAFPQEFRGMISIRPAWFVSVDPSAQFPRLVKIQLDESARKKSTRAMEAKEELLGPIEDKHAAQRFVELVEDAFDLCRYYNILTQAPDGKACAYKQMHKCPAPCDGTISMDQYRLTMQWAIETALAPSQEIANLTERMKNAAAALKFESAGKIKQFIDHLSQFASGPFRHMARLNDYHFISIQKGPRAHSAKIFLISVAGISSDICITDTRTLDSDLILHLQKATATPRCTDVDPDALAIVGRHLFAPKSVATSFIRARDLDEIRLKKALSDLKKQKEELTDDEGIVQESTGI